MPKSYTDDYIRRGDSLNILSVYACTSTLIKTHKYLGGNLASEFLRIMFINYNVDLFDRKLQHFYVKILQRNIDKRPDLTWARISPLYITLSLNF